jgi:hypothetical protein
MAAVVLGVIAGAGAAVFSGVVEREAFISFTSVIVVIVTLAAILSSVALLLSGRARSVSRAIAIASLSVLAAFYAISTVMRR